MFQHLPTTFIWVPKENGEIVSRGVPLHNNSWFLSCYPVTQYTWHTWNLIKEKITTAESHHKWGGFFATVSIHGNHPRPGCDWCSKDRKRQDLRIFAARPDRCFHGLLFLVASSYGKGMWVFICHKGGFEHYMMIFGDISRSVPSIWWPWHEMINPPIKWGRLKMFSDFRAASVDSHFF